MSANQELKLKTSADNPPVKNPLRQEESIVWLEDVSTQPYVRELITAATSRTGRLRYRGNGRAVGYSVLCRDAENNGGPREFTRRVFWLAPWDPYEEGGQPVEAVVPSTIAPGVKGAHPSRVKAQEPQQ